MLDDTWTRPVNVSTIWMELEATQAPKAIATPNAIHVHRVSLFRLPPCVVERVANGRGEEEEEER